MKQNLINDVVQAMLPYLNNAQTEKLQAVMQHELFSYDVVESESKGKDVLSGLWWTVGYCGRTVWSAYTFFYNNEKVDNLLANK